MNEIAARNVVLVRAIETSEVPESLWSSADAEWASRAAAGVVGAGAPADEFLARRAALAVERLAQRERGVPRALRALAWRPWIGWIVVGAALILGLATDYVGTAQRVNILAFPLLGLLGWNLLVYTFILIHPILALARPASRTPGFLARLIARLGGVSRGGELLHALAWRRACAREWMHVAAPLTAARVARVLHLAAMAFAIGAVAVFYLRGLVLDYRAGWESTFLGADQVQQVLAAVLAPASVLSGIPLADAAHLEAIRFPASTGENAAPWLHLYALTVALVVLAPRALLATLAALNQRRRERRLPIPLDQPYFQRLLRGFKGDSARIHVLPYSCQLGPHSVLALRAALARVLGPRVELTIAPAVAYGEEDALPAELVPAGPLALVLVVFSLSATPEGENHAAFVAAVGRQLGAATPLAILIDESGFRERFGAQSVRLEERRGAWRKLLDAQGMPALFLDLAQLDVAEAATAAEALLDRLEGTP